MMNRWLTFTLFVLVLTSQGPFEEQSALAFVTKKNGILFTKNLKPVEHHIYSKNPVDVPSIIQYQKENHSIVALSSSLNPIESWCITHMDVWYSKSLAIKCPFLRRRTADFLDGLDMIMRFLVIRHKSLPLIGPPPGCRSLTESQQAHKQTGLDLTDILEIIRSDWKTHNHKGYYITGRLNTTIYRDDCWFLGPDPDMPVKGLRKYLNAASQLFDTKTSTAELLSLQIGDKVQHELPSETHATIVATWKLQGVLHLPWHPSLPVWTGRTVYHLAEDNLIHCHEESWDISVLQAFMQTLWPQLGNRIWNMPTNDNQIIEAQG